MSPSLFTRLKNRLYAVPPNPKGIEAAPEEAAQDREVLERAIAKAVNASINNNDFLNNCTIHLASHLQPILKGTLDLSVVESKLLTSNGQLLRQIDEAKIQTIGDLESLSSLVDISNTTSTSRLSAIEAAVSQISTLITSLGSNVKSLQEQIVSPEITYSKLDIINAKLEEFHEGEIEPLRATLESHSIELGSISAGVRSIASDHASLKAAVETGNNSSKTSLSNLKTNLISILSTIETKTSIIAQSKDTRLKDENGSAKIFDTLNYSHKTFTEALSEIRSSIETGLANVKATDFSPEVLLAVRLSNESHKEHASVLSAIQKDLESRGSALDDAKKPPASRSLAEPVNLSTIEASIRRMATNVESQNDIITKVLAATSTPPPPAEKADLTVLETSLQTVITSIESQNFTLAEIKSVASASTQLAEKTDLTGIETSLNTMLNSVEGQSTILSSIEAATISHDILYDARLSKDVTDLNTAINSIGSSIDHQTATLSMIKTASLLAPELLTSIHAQATILEEIKKATTSTPDYDPETSNLQTSVKELIDSIDSQNAMLSELRSATSNTEILTAITSQDNLLIEMRQPTVEILARVTALLTKLEEAKEEIVVKTDKIKSFVISVPDLITAVLKQPSNKLVLEEVMAVKELVENHASDDKGTELDKVAQNVGKEKKVDGNYKLVVVDSPGRSRSSSRNNK